MISKENVKEFQRIFKQEYGIEYLDSEAEEASNNLVNYFQILIEMAQKLEKEGKLKVGPVGGNVLEGRRTPSSAVGLSDLNPQTPS